MTRTIIGSPKGRSRKPTVLATGRCRSFRFQALKGRRGFAVIVSLRRPFRTHEYDTIVTGG